jgi:hypothetical protein
VSYRINISVHDGIIGIDETGGELPEGSWIVGGHEDQYGAGVHVVRRLPNGRHVAEAQHHITHRNYDDSKFEVIEEKPAIEVQQYTDHSSLVQHIDVGPKEISDGTPKIYKGRITGSGESRPPYHVDIPLPEGERYPDSDWVCESCGRFLGSAEAPCGKCPDVNSVPSIDDFTEG